MPSFVWKYFTKTDAETACCKLKGCRKFFKWSKGSYGMIRHLKVSHDIGPDTARRPSIDGSPDEASPEPTAKRQKAVFKKSPMKTKVSESCFPRMNLLNPGFN